MVIALLLASQICLVAFQYTEAQINLKDKNSPSMIWLNCSIEGTGLSLFNCAHFILAVNYDKIATEAPMIINGKEVEQPSLCKRVIHWILLISCVISGPADAIVSSIFYTISVNQEKEPSNLLSDIKIAVDLWVAFSAIACGVILIVGVIKIKKFFKDKNAIDSIDTSTLTRHAVAFVLFLVGIVLWAIALAIYNVFPLSAKAQHASTVTIGIAYILSVVAEVCLCEVLYRWSTKSPEEEARQRCLTIETAEPDEEFDLQLRIWNQLVSKRLNDIEAD